MASVFTCFWKIKNFSRLSSDKQLVIDSPLFVTNNLNHCEWYLELRKECLEYLSFCILKENKPFDYNVHISAYYLTNSGWVSFLNKDWFRYDYSTVKQDSAKHLLVEWESIQLQKPGFEPQDPLCFCVRLQYGNNRSKPDHCFIVSSMMFETLCHYLIYDYPDDNNRDFHFPQLRTLTKDLTNYPCLGKLQLSEIENFEETEKRIFEKKDIENESTGLSLSGFEEATRFVLGKASQTDSVKDFIKNKTDEIDSQANVSHVLKASCQIKNSAVEDVAKGFLNESENSKRIDSYKHEPTKSTRQDSDFEGNGLKIMTNEFCWAKITRDNTLSECSEETYSHKGAKKEFVVKLIDVKQNLTPKFFKANDNVIGAVDKTNISKESADKWEEKTIIKTCTEYCEKESHLNCSPISFFEDDTFQNHALTKFFKEEIIMNSSPAKSYEEEANINDVSTNPSEKERNIYKISVKYSKEREYINSLPTMSSKERRNINSSLKKSLGSFLSETPSKSSEEETNVCNILTKPFTERKSCEDNVPNTSIEDDDICDRFMKKLPSYMNFLNFQEKLQNIIVGHFQNGILSIPCEEGGMLRSIIDLYKEHLNPSDYHKEKTDYSSILSNSYDQKEFHASKSFYESVDRMFKELNFQVKVCSVTADQFEKNIQPKSHEEQEFVRNIKNLYKEEENKITIASDNYKEKTNYNSIQSTSFDQKDSNLPISSYKDENSQIQSSEENNQSDAFVQKTSKKN